MPTEDAEAADALERVFRDEGIRVLTDVRVERLARNDDGSRRLFYSREG